MLNEAEPTTLAGLAGAFIAAVGAAVFTLRKLRVGWVTDGAAIATTGAQEALFKQLREELTRMADQRLLISGEMNKLQMHILDLTRQVTLLTAENVSLKREITDLRAEISRLHGLHDVK